MSEAKKGYDLKAAEWRAKLPVVAHDEPDRSDAPEAPPAEPEEEAGEAQ